MAGHLLIVRRYERADIRANPHVLVAFGDNLERAGYGGQAGAARDEPNAVGIPTKHGPGGEEAAFFSDADLDVAREAVDPAFERLLAHLRAGGDVWWPEGGIGTGLAELPTRAPVILACIDDWLARLKEAAE